MRLVDDDAEALMLQLATDSFQYVGELMYYGDDNLLATFQVIPQSLSTISPCNKVLQALKSNDIVLNLCIQIHTVCYYDYTIQQRLCSVQQSY